MARSVDDGEHDATGDAAGPHPVELTFAFVDLAGFTALTQVHGDGGAVATVDRFVEATRASLGPEDRLVKTIGDAVMLTSANPTDSVRMMARLVEATHEEPHFPETRAGLHHGPAVEHEDDYLGGAVNLAARVAGRAAADQTLATAEVASAATAAGIRVVSKGLIELHNLTEPVELFELGLCPGRAGTAVDPVCRARIERADAPARLRHEAVDYWFCSLDCAARFAASPRSYATG